mmetsp:Transcript_32032/g.68548  ORF Transcript_32032/g.68548 Transcript_32032/m.68548 type:complete len:258 (+) Transcript_32032:321-1094(+)
MACSRRISSCLLLSASLRRRFSASTLAWYSARARARASSSWRSSSSRRSLSSSAASCSLSSSSLLSVSMRSSSNSCSRRISSSFSASFAACRAAQISSLTPSSRPSSVCTSGSSAAFAAAASRCASRCCLCSCLCGGSAVRTGRSRSCWRSDDAPSLPFELCLACTIELKASETSATRIDFPAVSASFATRRALSLSQACQALSTSRALPQPGSLSKASNCSCSTSRTPSSSAKFCFLALCSNRWQQSSGAQSGKVK